MEQETKVKYTRWSFTANPELHEWLVNKQNQGFNISKIVRMILDDYIAQDREKKENK